MDDISRTRPQEFTSDIIWVAVSQVFILLTGLAILSSLSKSYGAEIYGVWAQIAVTVSLFIPILTLQLGIAAVRFLAAEEDRGERRRIFGVMLWPILIFSLLIVLISLGLRQDISRLLFDDPSYSVLVPLTFLLALTEALFIFSLSYLRARRRIRRLSIIQLLLSAVKIAGVVALAVAGYDLKWIVTYLIAVDAVFITAVMGMITSDVGFPWPVSKGLKYYLGFSIPIIPAVALMWVIDSSDRYFIAHLLDLSEVGIYSASYYLGALVSLFYLPIGFVLLPTVSRLWEQGKMPELRRYFEYSMRMYLALALPAVAGLYVVSQTLIRYLTTSDFVAGETLVLLITLGTVLLGIYHINVHVIYLTRKTKWLPLIFALGALTNAGINIALIPGLGIIAAAISTIVSFFILSIIVIVLAKRYINYSMDFLFLGKIIVSTLAMAFCIRFLEVDSALGIALAIFVGVVVYLLGLWLLRAFSLEEKQIIRETILRTKIRVPEGETEDDRGERLK